MKRTSFSLLLCILLAGISYGQDTIRADFQSTPVCSGEQTQFINKSYVPLPLGVADYLWKFGDDSTSTEQFGKHTYKLIDSLKSQVYDVTLIVTSRTNPPEIDSITIQTTVFGLPHVYFTWKVTNDGVNQEVSIDSLAVDDSTYFYQWNLGGVLKSNMRRPSFMGSDLTPFVDGQDHNFTLFMRSPDGCENQYVSIFNYDALSTWDVVQDRILFMPNPAANSISLTGHFDEVNVYNLHGQLVLGTNSDEQVLSIESLSPGTYVVHARNGHLTRSQRLVIQ